VNNGPTPEHALEAGPAQAGERGPRLVKATLDVAGMHCASCSALIEEALSAQPDVERVAVDLAGASADVVYDGGTLSVEDLCAVVTGLGYGASPRATSPRPADAGR
jgi:copper chaperone CopZ